MPVVEALGWSIWVSTHSTLPAAGAQGKGEPLIRGFLCALTWLSGEVTGDYIFFTDWKHLLWGH